MALRFSTLLSLSLVATLAASGCCDNKAATTTGTSGGLQTGGQTTGGSASASAGGTSAGSASTSAGGTSAGTASAGGTSGGGLGCTPACAVQDYCLNGTCTAKQQSGPCTANDACFGYCDNGSCVSCATDANCGSGFFCAVGVCLGKLGGGTPCTSGDQCQSGSCQGNSCTTPVSSGGTSSGSASASAGGTSAGSASASAGGTSSGSASASAGGTSAGTASAGGTSGGSSGGGSCAACTLDSECASGLFCLQGTCIPQLGDGTGCLGNDYCVSGVCTSNKCVGGVAATLGGGQGAVCPPACETGFQCLSGACAIAAINGVGCTEGTQCISGYCQSSGNNSGGTSGGSTGGITNPPPGSFPCPVADGTWDITTVTCNGQSSTTFAAATSWTIEVSDGGNYGAFIYATSIQSIPSAGIVGGAGSTTQEGPIWCSDAGSFIMLTEEQVGGQNCNPANWLGPAACAAGNGDLATWDLDVVSSTEIVMTMIPPDDTVIKTCTGTANQSNPLVVTAMYQ